MDNNYPDRLPMTCKPRAMSALLTADRKGVILASSMRKVRGYHRPERFNIRNEDLQRLLSRTILRRGSGVRFHRTGVCGELNTCSVFLKLFPGRNINPRLVSVSAHWEAWLNFLLVFSPAGREKHLQTQTTPSFSQSGNRRSHCQQRRKRRSIIMKPDILYLDADMQKMRISHFDYGQTFCCNGMVSKRWMSLLWMFHPSFLRFPHQDTSKIPCSWDWAGGSLLSSIASYIHGRKGWICRRLLHF